MGILGYPNMDDDNRDGVFGDYSDIYSNFTNETNNTSAEANEALAKTAYDDVSKTSGSEQENINVTSYKQKGSGSLFLYAVILLLLFLSAVGMFVYKKQIAESDTQMSEQAMGDYFYSQATTNVSDVKVVDETKNTEKKQGVDASKESVATVDVDLTETSSVDVKSEKAPAKIAQKAQTALEKAMQKKKTDEAKENIVSLGNSVVIPVNSAGRSDPFVPYGQVSVNKAVGPVFDIVAPPLAVPEVDPKTEKIFEFRLTGIMYDEVRPSAILVVDETQQLVHKGDVIMGYKILDITKKSVIVQYKTNTYEVCAGQSIEQGLNLTPVSTLSQQFGGAYTQPDANTIQFNN